MRMVFNGMSTQTDQSREQPHRDITSLDAQHGGSQTRSSSTLKRLKSFYSTKQYIISLVKVVNVKHQSGNVHGHVMFMYRQSQ
jgi:hypothetical protein